MRSSAAPLAALAACLAFSGQVEAQTTPAPQYIKKAVFVRLHFHQSFYNRFFTGSMIDLNAHLERYFEDVRRSYATSPGMQNVKLVMLDDFDRMTSPMLTYVDNDHWIATSPDGREIGGNHRLVNFMRNNLSTGPYYRTVNGVRHEVGRIVNWVFIHQGAGNQSGQANSIGGIGGADGNLYVTTSSGDFAYYRHTQRFPLKEMPRTEVLDTLMHETGHLLGGEHDPVAEKCGSEGASRGGEIMCPTISRDRYFGARNAAKLGQVFQRALGRCNTVWATENACHNHVDNAICGRILDYTQIAACQQAQRAALCSDICSTSRKQTQTVVDGLPYFIRENNRQPYRW
jgi:hypothetical protein